MKLISRNNSNYLNTNNDLDTVIVNDIQELEKDIIQK